GASVCTTERSTAILAFFVYKWFFALHYFFVYCSGDHRDLHSFPTRRSSDLGSFRPLPGMPAPYTSLLISRKSPSNKVCSMLPLAILKASTPNARMTTKRASETTMILAQ